MDCSRRTFCIGIPLYNYDCLQPEAQRLYLIFVSDNLRQLGGEGGMSAIQVIVIIV